MNYNFSVGQSFVFLISFAELCLTGHLFGRDTWSSANSPPGRDTFSLNQIIAAVLANNPAIQAARAKWTAARERVPQAAAWDDPKLTGGTIFARFVSIPANSFTDQTMSVEQMIPVSGKNRSKERIATAEALVALEEARRHSLDIIAKAKSGYYLLKNLNALLDLNKADEASLVQSADATRARFEAGKQGQASVLLTETERQKVVEARRDLEQQLSDAQSNLNVLMNRDPFSPIHIAPDDGMESLPAPAEKLRELILTNRPEVREAQARLTAANAKLELAKREWIPDPTVSLEAERYNGGSQTVSQVGGGVSISLPWFNGRKYRAEEAEARSEAFAAQSELTNAQTQASGLLRNQLEKIEALHHHIELYRGNLLPAARQTVASYLADYQADKADLQTLLSSQRNLFELETMYARDTAEFDTALVELDALVGLEQRPSATGKHHQEQQTK
ncbi:MAG: TolC family protein [Verrucomicrobia bacterium]|nr:TolC family protein [Verrucomicrobiota bacterium]